MADKHELKQSRSVGKTAGAREARSIARNPNRDPRGDPPPLPDMSENTSLVTVDGPRDEILEQCMELRRAGNTIPQVAEALGLPVETLYAWREERPDFFEGMQTGFDDFVEQKAEEVLSIADQLPKVRGLRPADRMLAMKHQAGIRLRVAEAKLPSWRPKDEGGGGVLFQVSLSGPVKTTNLPGSPDGQNILALKAGRWQIPPREEALLDRPRGNDDGPGASGPGKRPGRRLGASSSPGRTEQAQGAEGA